MKKYIKMITGLPWWVKNIYFVTSVFFIVWMLFFDRNNSFATYQINKQLSNLQEQKIYYETEITKVNVLKEELFSNDEKKEKFAREKYFMKKSNEDIFIIIEEK